MATIPDFKGNFNLRSLLLLIQVFIVSACSLTYELLLGTAYATITGNSILAYSISIGLFLAGLGSGAFCSRWIKDPNLGNAFIWIEITLAVIGGLSVTGIYWALIFTPQFQIAHILVTLSIGFLSGLEIPILTRILNNQDDYEIKGILANVLSFDYLGGLIASVLFPIALLPYLGLIRLNLLTGLANTLMAGLALTLFWTFSKHKKIQLISLVIIATGLITAIFYSSSLYSFLETRLYKDPIIYSTQTSYQRLVITQKAGDTRLFLNGGIQFSSLDEYRYHESLVMPAMAKLSSQYSKPLNIAVLGGGDGLAVRELLKFESQIDQIHLIDIDPQVTDLARDSFLFQNLNQNSLSHPKVSVHNLDAWLWIQQQQPQSLDLILADFPDPDDISIAKLYSKEFYNFCFQKLTQQGLLVTQSSSILNSPKSFWSIHKTLQNVFTQVEPYQVYVPSFGLWGFQIASKNNDFDHQNLRLSSQIQNQNRFLNNQTISQLFILDLDTLNPKTKQGIPVNKVDLQINSIQNPVLSSYYLDSIDR